LCRCRVLPMVLLFPALAVAQGNPVVEIGIGGIVRRSH